MLCNHNYMSTEQGESGPGQETGGTAAGQGGQSKNDAAAELRAWFSGRLPGEWFIAVPDIQVDREEITVVGALSDPASAGASDAERSAAAEGRIRRFREETRNRRIDIAREAEH